jgi:rare lipoprotein A (peptidoglycan hydrolase)
MRTKYLLCGALAALSTLAAACPGIAAAQSGGVTGGGGSGPTTPAATTADPTFYDVPFGSRDLSVGTRGTDVQTLNWVLRGLALGTDYSGEFAQTTDGAVRSFQSSAGVAANGVVGQSTRKALAGHMLNQYASWYGPGFYGNQTACGKVLKKGTIGVAHKKLPCGSRVTFAYQGHWVRAKVIDRGPYVRGRKWDLTEALATKLGTIPVGTAKVKAVVAP